MSADCTYMYMYMYIVCVFAYNVWSVVYRVMWYTAHFSFSSNMFTTASVKIGVYTSGAALSCSPHAGWGKERELLLPLDCRKEAALLQIAAGAHCLLETDTLHSFSHLMNVCRSILTHCTITCMCAACILHVQRIYMHLPSYHSQLPPGETKVSLQSEANFRWNVNTKTCIF